MATEKKKINTWREMTFSEVPVSQQQHLSVATSVQPSKMFSELTNNFFLYYLPSPSSFCQQLQHIFVLFRSLSLQTSFTMFDCGFEWTLWLAFQF